jgi:hypothetical protein
MTTTTDTPRTDALMLPHGALATNLLEHARKLEREANFLRNALALGGPLNKKQQEYFKEYYKK